MNVILIVFLSLASLISPLYSHGSKEDCKTECNNYYCPPEMKTNKEKNSSVNK